MTAPLAIAGLIGAGAALGASSSKPSMEVLPSTKGLKYQQVVEIKGHHLPKGSGSVAATICGLNDAAGKKIAKPGADDCAGSAEIGKLVIVKSWQSNGEFDTKYTLPSSGQTFGKNKRFCNKSHYCALVVADANPSAPAYYVATNIYFFDQSSSTTPTTKGKSTPTTKPKSTPTTKPKPKPTTTTTAPPAFSAHAQVSAAPGGAGSGGFQGGGDVKVYTPTTPPGGGGPTPTLPAITVPKGSGSPIPPQVSQGLEQACTQIGDAVKKAGGDPSGLLTACAAIAGGGGPEQLLPVLQAPVLLCVLGAPTWQNNPQITAACNQAATAVTPVTSQLAGVLGPVLSP
ncbi:MAG TPA: hypothetical protein VGP92_12845 [Acidimicrobiia bacterium]|nr:hypothetical protein [Acidimicrobiia bacterium]